MNAQNRIAVSNPPALTNGAGAAAILAAGIGCFALAVLALAADKSAPIKSLLSFYKPTGALSGVTTTAILVWLLTWGILEWRWEKKNVVLGRISVASFVLLAMGFLLTFPLVADLF
jgi:hypothetical protein